MSNVTIIGAGNMADAIAGISSKSGAAVQIVARDAAKAAELAAATGATAAAYGDALTGDIVILAVPYPAVESIIATYADALNGAIVVDITNPLDFSTFDSLVTPADSSAAAVIAAALPGAKVVKAFNTTFAATLATGSAGSVATTVLIAGDDAEAKQAVIDLVTGGGVASIDTGALKRARELEALGFLQLTLAVGEKTPWTGGFALTR
jgi:predicted dinucleotide-binding enzyme